MRFWQLRAPEYDSDYQETFINGSLSYPFKLPLMRCDRCGSAPRGFRVLRFECTQEDWDSFGIGKGWPLPSDQHRALRVRILERFLQRGVTLPELEPGDRFLPCYLDVPSRPRADFLWSSLYGVVVSERVRQVFQRLHVPSVEFYEVAFRKIGKREARLPPPEPSTGEPEDTIDEVPLLQNTQTV